MIDGDHFSVSVNCLKTGSLVRMLNDVTAIWTTELNRKTGTEIFASTTCLLFILFIFAMKYKKGTGHEVKKSNTLSTNLFDEKQ